MIVGSIAPPTRFYSQKEYSVAYATCCRKIKTYSIKNHAWYRRINTQLQYIFIDSSSSHKHVHKIVCMYHVYATACCLDFVAVEPSDRKAMVSTSANLHLTSSRFCSTLRLYYEGCQSTLIDRHSWQLFIGLVWLLSVRSTMQYI